MKRIHCLLLPAVSFCVPAMADISDAGKEARIAANAEAFKAMLNANGYKYTAEDGNVWAGIVQSSWKFVAND